VAIDSHCCPKINKKLINKENATQQSVLRNSPPVSCGWKVGPAYQEVLQPTGGILRRFQAFSWLRVFSAPQPNPSPPTSG